MRIPLLLVPLLLCAAPAAAQDVVRPGSAQVAGDSIPERMDEFEMYDLEDDTEPFGEMRLRTRFTTIGGVEAIARKEMVLVEGDLVQADSFALERRTLAPLHVRIGGQEQTVWLDFGPGRVRKTIEGDWGADTTHVALDAPVFYAAAMDLLLGALPLAEGYTAQVALYEWVEDRRQTVRIRVEEAETLRLPGGGRARTWRVDVPEGGSAGTYWMDRESRTLVQYESMDGMRIVRSRAARSRARPTR